MKKMFAFKNLAFAYVGIGLSLFVGTVGALPATDDTVQAEPSISEQIASLRQELRTARNPQRISEIKKQIRALSNQSSESTQTRSTGLLPIEEPATESRGDASTPVAETISTEDQIAALKRELRTARNPQRINAIKTKIRELSAQ